jgi:non-ribosomal peptide synthetase component F
VQEFAAHYAILLDSMLRDHDQPISHARLLSDADAQHLINSVGVGQEGLGGPRDQYELGAPVHELFERHAAADPDAPAVVDTVTGVCLQKSASLSWQ